MISVFVIKREYRAPRPEPLGSPQAPTQRRPGRRMSPRARRGGYPAAPASRGQCSRHTVCGPAPPGPRGPGAPLLTS
eukprot:745897-Hanusia_phi.AAC.8